MRKTAISALIFYGFPAILSIVLLKLKINKNIKKTILLIPPFVFLISFIFWLSSGTWVKIFPAIKQIDFLALIQMVYTSAAISVITIIFYIIAFGNEGKNTTNDLH